MNAPRYPKFNEPFKTTRPVLNLFSQSPLGELIWLAIPIVVVALALLTQ